MKKKLILKYFLLARDRGAMVVDFLDCSIGDIHWKSPFLRPVQDQELESMMLFLDELFTAIILQDVGNKPLWSLSKGHGFHIKEYCNGDDRILLARYVVSRSSSLYGLFGWTATMNQILTLYNLQR